MQFHKKDVETNLEIDQLYQTIKQVSDNQNNKLRQKKSTPYAETASGNMLKA